MKQNERVMKEHLRWLMGLSMDELVWFRAHVKR